MMIPLDIKYYIGSDSSLTLYERKAGNKSKQGTSIHRVLRRNDCYAITSAIVNGATCRSILNALPTQQREIDSYDVTLVVCMLSKISGDAITRFSEASSAGVDLRDLCLQPMKLKRPMLILGGSADLWGYPP